jgi:hypothetical protein
MEKTRTYKVTWEEIVSRTVVVSADSLQEALEKGINTTSYVHSEVVEGFGEPEVRAID